MDKKTKKMKSDKASAKGKFSFHIDEGDVIDVSNFGSFDVIRTKRGILFRTYGGYHVWTTPYTVDFNGNTMYNSLYAWLENLVEASKAFKGHEDEHIEEDKNVTKGEILEDLKVITVANLLMPTTVFLDENKAAEAANSYLEWLDTMQSKLISAMNGKITEDIDEAEYAKERTKAEVSDTLNEMIQEINE